MRGPHVSFISILSFPCLRAVALQRAGVETGIQDMKNWIPAGVYPVLDTGQE
jgi:hypothetical protein